MHAALRKYVAEIVQEVLLDETEDMTYHFEQ